MSRKSSGVGDLARLSTIFNQIEETEIRATLLSDSFGAEELSAQSSDAMDAPVRANAYELILHCPSCFAETFLGDRFCQECGGVQPAFEEDKGKLSFDVVKQLVASNSKGLLVSIALSVSVVLLIAGVFSVLQMSDDLEKALAANRLNEAIALSERLMVSHFGALSGHDAELYSRAFFRRAQVFAKNGNFKGALFDISKVLPDYSKSEEVAQLKAFYAGQVGRISPSVIKSGATAGGDSPAGRTASATTSVAEPTAIHGSTSARGLRSNAAAPAAAAPSSANDYSAKKSSSFSSTTSASSSSMKELSQEQQAALSEATNCEPEEVDSEEADMAAYNRHLAEYFSKRNANSPAKEPPSFSEWVQSGKKEF